LQFSVLVAFLALSFDQPSPQLPLNLFQIGRRFVIGRMRGTVEQLARENLFWPRARFHGDY
jgi:hypothetical protein